MPMSPAPQHTSDETWFYDDKRGLLVVHECRKDGEFVQTDQFVIPWRAIDAAIKRRKAK